jgi:predicted transcriptional regulator
MGKKEQFTVYLDPATMRALESFAADRRKPKSLVAEAAITSFLTPDDSDRREAAVAKRLDRIARVLERLERNDAVALETVALFVRYWLTATPSLPEQTTAAARVKGAERYDRFVAALGRRLANGPGLLREISSDIPDDVALNG